MLSDVYKHRGRNELKYSAAILESLMMKMKKFRSIDDPNGYGAVPDEFSDDVSWNSEIPCSEFCWNQLILLKMKN